MPGHRMAYHFGPLFEKRISFIGPTRPKDRVADEPVFSSSRVQLTTKGIPSELDAITSPDDVTPGQAAAGRSTKNVSAARARMRRDVMLEAPAESPRRITRSEA